MQQATTANTYLSTASKKQQGSALLMAIFIMVVLMLLGTALVKVLSTSSEGIAQEVLGTRALMAAKAGAEAELTKLFPLNGAISACNSSTSYDNFSNVSGLNNCRAVTSCNNYANHDAGEGEVNYYRITSTGHCGIGNVDSDGVVLSTRRVQVEARSL